ncbi:hypothetical protein DFP72DRAFT_867876 [Ephemerocybe angulata]|uniref:MYND-type domain-containing protein n=1 Tax=Ephemerocybe angulata TaxID=980116 RepID=A0A8H6MEC2_9AGAR|nr:hypothetical protein DFP72DRAFT_867876 [Tulosesus angulatus]
MHAIDGTLGHLGYSLVPPRRDLETLDPNRISHALAALEDLLSCLLGLYYNRHMSSRDPTPYETRLYRKLVDRWLGIIAWLEYLVVYDPVTLGITCILRDFLVALTTMLHLERVPAAEYVEEVIAMPQTVDFIFLMLYQVDPKTGAPYSFPESPLFPCHLIQVFSIYSESEVGITAMLGWLRSTKPQTRERITSSLRARARDLANTTGDDISGAIMSMACLYYFVCPILHSLRRCVHYYDLIKTFSAALLKLTEKGVARGITEPELWLQIGHSLSSILVMVTEIVPNPFKAVSKAIEGGLLTIILKSGPYTQKHSPEVMTKCLNALIPYLYLSKPFNAVVQRGDFQLFRNPPFPIPESMQAAYSGYIAAMTRNLHTYNHRSASPNTCSNLRHPAGGRDAAMKSCSACHSVFYCSSACQGVDWIAFHSKECRPLADQASIMKEAGVWASFQTRRDQLIHIQTTANACLLLPSVLDSMPLLGTGAPACGPLVILFDFVDITGPIAPKPVPLDVREAVWDARVQTYAKESKDDLGRIVLVEGIFPFTNLVQHYVLVKMRWNPEAPPGSRYTVLSSVVRMAAFLSNDSDALTVT